MNKARLIENMQRKFDEIVLGETVDEYSYPMTPGRALSYLEGVDETGNAFYTADAASGARAVPTTALENDVIYSRVSREMISLMVPLRDLLAGQTSTFLKPLQTGETITVKMAFVDKFIKRSKFYVSQKSSSHDSAGDVLLENLYTHCCTGADGQEDTPRTLEDPFARKIDLAALQAVTGEKAAAADPGVAEKTEIESRVKRVTMEMTKLFWHFPADRHFHNDSQLAQSVGFPGPVMGGSQGNAILSEMCHSYFGDSWFTSGQMSVKPLVSVHPPATLTARGVVSSKEAEGDGTRIHLDIWLENEKREAVQLGFASCRVPAQ